MKIYKYGTEGGFESDASQLTRLQATVSNGLATIKRRLYFEAEAPNEDAIDILSLPSFPQKYSAHPRHPSYKYYGNADIQPISENSKYWYAELEYSTTDPNATDSSGNVVTSETPPWKLRPDNIQISYPEIVMPFEASFNDKGVLYDNQGKIVSPVVNSAGDKIPLETSTRNLELSFSFATQKWNVKNAIIYGNSINLSEMTVCGFVIPQHYGLLLPPECNYITVYEDGSTRIKWQYWQVNIKIQVDLFGNIWKKTVLDVGDRAKFKQIDLSADEMLQDAIQYGSLGSLSSDFTKISATEKLSQICHFRLTKRYETSPTSYWPASDKVIICSWDQYLQARAIYLKASRILKDRRRIADLYDLQCEQDTKMPLEDGYVYTKAIPGCSDYVENTPYKQLTFRPYPFRSWSELNLPKKGVNW